MNTKKEEKKEKKLYFQNRDALVYEENGKKTVFSLTKVSVTQLKDFRRTYNKPFLVLKEGNLLWIAKIRKGLPFLSSDPFNKHMCASSSGIICKRLSAKPDEAGGCARIRELGYACIEDYDFVKLGFQTVGLSQNTFTIVECTHFGKAAPRRTRSIEEINKSRLGLGQFMWDDIEDLNQLSQRIKKLGGKGARFFEDPLEKKKNKK